MNAKTWKTTQQRISRLLLDSKNPRLGRETMAGSPREIIQYLFEHDKTLEIAQSIVTRGYFPNEPLLAVRENNQLVVVEGNRRLAALKALNDPTLLEGPMRGKLERLAKKIVDPDSIISVPVTSAPNRRATDPLIAGRHIGTPVLAWQAENRASFIVTKLDEGYSNKELDEELGFSQLDITSARRTHAIAHMARSLDLPEEIKAKLENRPNNVLSTLERVFNSTIGRDYLKVRPDPDSGLRGTTSETEFLRGFTRLVRDVALGNVTSRTLNTNEDIRKYFNSWDPKELPAHKAGSFVPSDIIQNRPTAPSILRSNRTSKQAKSDKLSKTVLPNDFKIKFGNDRLKDIRNELTKLERDKFPNAGAILLRVFLELAIKHYLESIGELNVSNNNKEYTGLKILSQRVIRVIKHKMPANKIRTVEKALKYDKSAPFTISELHGFVHGNDFPSARDIFQFWKRTEPLFRFMLEEEPEHSK
jgi:hypothetical protein